MEEDELRLWTTHRIARLQQPQGSLGGVVGSENNIGLSASRGLLSSCADYRCERGHRYETINVSSQINLDHIPVL